MVNRRTTSPTPRTSRPRMRQARRSWSIRSAGLRDPSFGGTLVSSGPRTSATPASHASHFGMFSASFFENLEISSKFFLASSG